MLYGVDKYVEVEIIVRIMECRLCFASKSRRVQTLRLTERLPTGSRYCVNDDRSYLTVGKGNLPENQFEESFCSCSRTKLIDGRFDSWFSYCSDQLS